MQIRRVSIGSFGNLKDKEFEFDKGFTVFYGPNESGKTTTMEFIRSVLVPNPTKRKTYPERSRTDSGSLFYTENGSNGKVSLEYNRVSGDIPECTTGLDPETFRSIFALTREGLDDMAPFINGDIRSRFLTIPGGDTIPDVMGQVEADVQMLLGKTSNSPSRINDLNREDAINKQKMSELKADAETYGILVEEKEGLTRELDGIRKANSSAEANNQVFAKIESQKAAFRSLEEFRAKKEAIIREGTVSPEDIDRHDNLRNRYEGKRNAYETLKSECDQAFRKLGADEDTILSSIPRINSVLSRRAESESRRAAPAQTVRPPSRRSIYLPLVLVATALVLLAVPGFEIIVKGIASGALMVSAIVLFMLIRNKPNTGPDRNGRWLEDYWNEVRGICAVLGYAPVSLQEGLEKLSEIKEGYGSVLSTMNRLKDLQMECLQAKNDYLEFLSAYGGESGYQRALENRGRLSSVNSSITALSQSIRRSGLDPDRPLPSVEKVDVDRTRERDVVERIGVLSERIKNVMNTEELDALIDKDYAITAEREKVLRQGAVAILGAELLEKSCSEQYENVHPEVVSITDSYLSKMTSGRYRVDTDPRNQEITVVSDGISKGPKQWSSGLRAQILLSLKLAIAKEMGGGKVPVILDDVLLPFDSERKRGAVDALADISSEMQILMFTCDREVFELAKGNESCGIICF